MRLLRRPTEPPDPSTLEIRRVLLASEGRSIPPSAIGFAAKLGAPVRVFSVARVYGVAFAFPNPWLTPSRKEWQEQREIVARAVKALERQGVKADGHVVGTRKATRGILREAARQDCDVTVMAAEPPRNRLPADPTRWQAPYPRRRPAAAHEERAPPSVRDSP